MSKYDILVAKYNNVREESIYGHYFQLYVYKDRFKILYIYIMAAFIWNDGENY